MNSTDRPMLTAWRMYRSNVLIPQHGAMTAELLEMFRVTFYAGAGLFSDAQRFKLDAAALVEIEQVIPMHRKIT